MQNLKNTILSVTRRTTKGFTVGEIFDRVENRFVNNSVNPPAYSTVRARVYELADSGLLTANAVRKDTISNRVATTFVKS